MKSVQSSRKGVDMLRRLVLFLLVLSVPSMMLANPGTLMSVMAAPGNSISFVNVSPTSCTPSINDSIEVHVTISVAPNNSHRVDNWSISNPMGMSMANMSASPGAAVDGKGRSYPGYMWMAVPPGTMPGDLLTVTVQMVSVINKKTITNTVSGSFNCSTGQFVSTASTTQALRFPDGRVNQQPEQSVAVYPSSKGSYVFYAVDKGVGSMALQVTKAQLDANPDKGYNYLITENMGVRLYRLAGGMLQVRRYKPDGKEYIYTWSG